MICLIWNVDQRFQPSRIIRLHSLQKQTLISEAKLAEDVANSQKDLAIFKNISTFHGLLKGILKVKAGAALACFVQKINDVVTVFHIS